MKRVITSGFAITFSLMVLACTGEEPLGPEAPSPLFNMNGSAGMVSGQVGFGVVNFNIQAQLTPNGKGVGVIE